MLLLLTNVEGVTNSPDGNQFQGFVVQVAMEAILLVTSTNPVEERIKQHMLHGLSNAGGQQLLQRIAPNISPVSAHEAVQLCLGMPLLIRLIGEALASQRLSIQDVRNSAVPPGAGQS
ncbi:hypothetical protein DUNSADRAFT_1953 [Dunaliella salina]|uniref:Encoded protein n=1 Tax=Dunaliella salina TaxID=3046 RepID=A0ABQ7GWE3_DUNSA|nr:hypothetical protein DUNSADRAFT_1953 [Dunaliella salina]|eukprot:KAF5838937.1 hypothetical protein DUNSADRAFT_1953 [Dunaliella salina]